MNPVSGVQNNALEGLAKQATQGAVAAPGKGDEFGQTLMDVLKQVDSSQQTAATTENAFLTGQPAVEYHDLMIAMEKASIAMQLTMAVRNKILDAYSEIDKMQV